MAVRLSAEEIKTLKDCLLALSLEACLYLFGSRTDDTKARWCIDLLVVSNVLSQKDLRRFCVEFCRRFGEPKIDIVLDDGSFTTVFHRIIKEKAVLL